VVSRGIVRGGDAGLWYERAFQVCVCSRVGPCVCFWIHAPPNLEEIAKLAWLDEINVIINKAVVRLKPQAAVFAVDPAGAARVTEDLDYRIAQLIGSVEGWRSFLAVHGRGVHTQTATGEVERLLVSEQASAQTTPKVSNETSLGGRAAGDPIRPAPRFPPGPKLRRSPPRAGSAAWATKRRCPLQKYRTQTRWQRARPCNPPHLPRGCRSRPLHPTKTASVMGIV
jgi:hypothetical protein